MPRASGRATAALVALASLLGASVVAIPTVAHAAGTITISGRVWLDDSSDPAQWSPGGSRNNALLDATDDGNLTQAGLQNPGVAGVRVNLYWDLEADGVLSSTDPQIASTTSGPTGAYAFTEVPPGTPFLIQVAPEAFAPGSPLSGFVSSNDQVAQPNPVQDVAGDDNGVDEASPATKGVASRLLPDRSITTIDFGFTRPPMSLGNQVWVDDHPTTQSLRNNGLRDTGETGLSNVEMALYRDLNNNGQVDAGEDTGLRDTTNANGFYLFSNLPAGSYVVAVTQANFSTGGPLENTISSRSVGPNPTASDSGVDNNDNGVDTFVAGIGIISSRIALGAGAEPTSESPVNTPVGGPNGRGTHGERDNDSDLTVDFGFYVPMSLGNRVWLDDTDTSANASKRDNGVLDPGGDDLDNPNLAGSQGLGVAGVTVRLYRDLDADGVVDPGEDTGRTTTTGASGYYLFDGLTRGSYLVGVEASNFANGAVLRGFRSSTNATLPVDDDVDGVDKGVGTTPSPIVGVVSTSILLSYSSSTAGSEPTTESDPTPQGQSNRGSNGERNDFSNLTVDFGFVRTTRPPSAAADSYTTAFGVTKTVGAAAGVLGNDTDPDGDTLSAVLGTGPAHGTLTLSSDGSFTYVPTGGYSGDDSFTYRASDGTTTSAPATVTLTVSTNQTPTASADSYTTNYGTTLTVASPGVLGNDNDPESKTLTATAVDQPTKGTLTLNSDGSLSYVPNTGASGPDSFTYTVSDGYATSSPATVQLTINPKPNTAPTATGESYTTAFGTTKTVSAANGVLDNDTDADGDTLTAALVDDVTHGTLTLSSDGSFTYLPTAGYSGGDSFTYRASDGTTTSAPATVALTVSANQPPTASANSYTTNYGTTLTVASPGVLGNDNDPEGKTLTATAVDQPTKGTLTLTSDGSLGYVPNTGASGPDSFTYTVSDGYATSAAATVTLTIRPRPNTAPQASADAYTTAYGATLVIGAPGVLGNDTDGDADPLTAVLEDSPAHGTLTLRPDGSLTYVPAAGHAGVDSFTYRATDGTLSSNVATVTVTTGAGPVVTPPPTTLSTAPLQHRRGRMMTIVVGGFAPGESYVVRIGRFVVASGVAGPDGSFTRKVRLPRRAHRPRTTLTVAGPQHVVSKTIRIKDLYPYR